MKNGNIYDGYLEWKNWGESFGLIDDCTRRYYDLELKKIEGNLKGQNIRVLEIGFGNGSFLTYALERGWSVYGIEVNDDLITIANKKGFQVCSTMDYLEDNVFDLIVAFDVLEHITSNELIEFTVKIKSKLKNGGFFVARFPNGDSPIGMKNQNGDLTHLNCIGSNKIIQLSKYCDFKLLFIKGQSEIFIYKSIKKTFYTIALYPIKLFINLIMKVFFFPTTYYFFCSENLVVFFKKEI
ncbi:hypothetical protein AY606_10395 [Acinetobacter sp. SFB]|uniref:class I SAM-dependent methyltransferase n=1 Tax=Acinetobacter sp. SFB TaxID=1805634 RepID=UPI0007D767B2|nr:class I SAM-dependent methyltransferase [Acinetobacter sp. SFB]OAL77851.1 hypothetical protein AY606_10395 [Acinetobacter sp. SFB]